MKQTEELLAPCDVSLSGGGPTLDGRAVSMEHGDHGPVSVEVGIVDRDSPGIVLERRLPHDADVYCVRSGTIGRLSFARSWMALIEISRWFPGVS
jgi:hypothetical protein